MTASDQEDGAWKGEAGVFRSHRTSRVIVSAEEPVAKGRLTSENPTAKLQSQYATPLGNAYAATFDGGEPELWQFYETLAEARVFVLLDDGHDQSKFEPKVFSLKDSSYLLAFDVAEQADELTGSNAPTSPALGMDLFKLLRGRNIGLGVNMGGTTSATLISGDTIDMICAFYDGSAGEELVPDGVASQFRALLAPQNFPDTVQLSLTDNLSLLGATFRKALLLQAEYEDGQTGYIVGVTGALEEDRPAISAAVEASLVASRRADVRLDVAFLASDEPMAERIERVGLTLKAGKRT